MHDRVLRTLIIGVFSLSFSYAEGEISQESANSKGLVYVEPDHIQKIKEDKEYKLEPYRVRRPRWGKTVSVGYSAFEPTNYEPNFAAVTYSELYTTAEMPMIDVTFVLKRNMTFGSIGGEFSAGIYSNRSDSPDLVDSTLHLYPVRLGGVLVLDTLMNEPYIVPYVSGGGYIVFYKEALGDNTFNGNTLLAGYMRGGFAFQLDWIDRASARASYRDSGIESTYAYVEAQTQMAAGDEQDPDFSTDVNWAAGVRVEF